MCIRDRSTQSTWVIIIISLLYNNILIISFSEAPPKERYKQGHIYKMQIFVKTLDGKLLTIDVEPTTTVKQLKLKISEKGQFQPNQQYLVYLAKPLDEKTENMTLNELDIHNQSQLFLVLRLKG
eukprot:TRINITY_DN14575_c0_g1_i1.p2 TRINITY_DN14575_c0_g1~~TRINITY_DN14575_c0_g1_i1.p2  ORF type:complete len:124 (+),score=22.85 TRINITY_DN14575_c0_g1_i1:188-559(+)